MNIKSKQGDLQSPSLTMPCWHINEGSRQFIWCKHSNICTAKGIKSFSRVIWHNHILSYNCCGHSSRRNDYLNTICTSWIINDYIYQNANIICYKHNIHLSLWWLITWDWKNMNLLVQDMKPNIPSNGSVKISNYIMCDNVISFVSTTK
jgi:hypothetical protein